MNSSEEQLAAVGDVDGTIDSTTLHACAVLAAQILMFFWLARVLLTGRYRCA